MKRRFSLSTGSATVVSPTEGQTNTETDCGQYVLRLSKRLNQSVLSGARRLSKELSDSRTPKDVLQTLLHFLKQLPLESVDDTEFAAKVIVERASKEEDVANRMKMFSILGILLRYPGVNLKYILEEVIRCINKEGELDVHKRTSPNHFSYAVISVQDLS